MRSSAEYSEPSDSRIHQENKQAERMAQLPGKILRFRNQEQAVQQDESHDFGVLKTNSEFLNQIFSVKRCNTLVKSKVEQRQNETEPKFKIRKRDQEYKLPEAPFKILAAPDVNSDLYTNILDWSP